MPPEDRAPRRIAQWRQGGAGFCGTVFSVSGTLTFPAPDPGSLLFVKGAAMLGAVGDLEYITAAGLLGGGELVVDGCGAR